MNKILRKPTFVSTALICAMMVGCSSEEQDGQDETAIVVPTYYGEAKAILDTRCATCHQPNDIGSFPPTTYEEVKAFEGAVRASILNGSMPPWQPGDDCNTYVDNIDLRPDEKEVLLAWLDGGAPEGEPTDASASSSSLETAPFVADIAVALPEAYTPSPEKPDDHRCQLIPWPAEETRYVTGLRVVPDERPIVHHTIVFVIGPDQVAEYQHLMRLRKARAMRLWRTKACRRGAARALEALPVFLHRLVFGFLAHQRRPFRKEQGFGLSRARCWSSRCTTIPERLHPWPTNPLLRSQPPIRSSERGSWFRCLILAGNQRPIWRGTDDHSSRRSECRSRYIGGIRLTLPQTSRSALRTCG